MKLRAHEYCACIGFAENKAIVSKKAARQYKRYDVARFLQAELYKQAFSLAYYQQDEALMQEVLKELQNKIAAQNKSEHASAEAETQDLQPSRNIAPQSISDLVKLFGNIPAPEYLSGILYV